MHKSLYFLLCVIVEVYLTVRQTRWTGIIVSVIAIR